jgi:hypothetical protein
MKTSTQTTYFFMAALFAVSSIAIVTTERQADASTFMSAPFSDPCRETGNDCAVGMTGPQGGTIFYDAGSQQWWGQYLEAENGSTVAEGIWGSASSIYGASGNVAAQRQSMSIGMGRINTTLMKAAASPLAVGHTSDGSDWYIPSKDELSALYDFRASQKSWRSTPIPMWTSSESEDSFAWYQLFHDGTQFTDANGVINRLTTNKSYMKSAVHKGSNFKSSPMGVNRVRAFPYQGAQPPAFALVTEINVNPPCSSSAIGCRIGDAGPGGGIIVYDAGSQQSWGQYLEVAPKSCETSRVAYSPARYVMSTLFPNATARLASKAIGAGKANTAKLKKMASPAAEAASQECNGVRDWFLPSKDELNEAFRWLSHGRKGQQLTPVGGFARGYYWTSSDYNGSTAWSQYFADGQQFDREQWFTGNRDKFQRPFNVRPMRAFSAGQKTEVGGPAITERSILIEGSRAINGGNRTATVTVNGTTTGFAEGSSVAAFIRFPGQVDYSRSINVITIGADGTFTWSRRTSKRIAVYVRSEDGTMSNTVIIPAS